MDSRVFGVCVLAWVVCACAGKGTTTGEETPGSGGGSPSGIGGGVGGTPPGGSNGMGGTLASPSSGGTVGIIPERPIPSGACQSDGDCIAVYDSSIRCDVSGNCPDPIPANRDDLNGDLCLWLDGHPDRPECSQRGEAIACPSDGACALCSVPRCQAGKCTLDIGRTFEACDALERPCVRLDKEWPQAYRAASSCDTGAESNCATTITDPCGCPQSVNAQSPELVAVAQKVAEAAAAASCFDCTQQCLPYVFGCNTQCSEGECLFFDNCK